MNRFLMLFLFFLSIVYGDINFEEQFALSDNRKEVLKQLIPGTKNYYYYHCLYYQHQNDLVAASKLLHLWVKRHGYTQKVREMINRQALLIYEKSPRYTLGYIRKQLRLRFNHQKKHLKPKTNYATSLNQKFISSNAFAKRALKRYRHNLHGFKDSALDFLVQQQLPANKRRDLLRRLKRPDYPGLSRLVVDDLRHRYSRGFGAFSIHRQMLLSQLDECLLLMPALLNNTNFIYAYISKLLPNDDANRNTPEEKEAYIKRLWKFVKRLTSAHNSLKAHVLYHWLLQERSLGVYNKKRFLDYIKLPRQMWYMNKDYLKLREHRHRHANLHSNYRSYTGFASVGRDEPLVRSFLEHFFRTEKEFKPYAKYLDYNYLQKVFATTKMLFGVGNMEKMYSLISPEKLKQLKERVDLEFLPSNKEKFAVNESVELTLAIKNISTLIIKVYEINTVNYYHEYKREISTAVALDGLEANEEKIVNYKQAPIRRHIEKFSFASLKQRGVYVVEFIGNGRSSRALIRKGKINFIQRIGAAGHVLTVVDENHKPLPQAKLYLSGHEYKADKNGEIDIPFSTNPGQQTIIIKNGSFANIYQFYHQKEHYNFQAGIYVDRESLLAGKKCRALFFPRLTVHGASADISLLEEVSLLINSKDQQGINSNKEVKDFKLHSDKESFYEFRVPENLAQISFTLKAKVQNISRNKKIALSAHKIFSVNAIDKTTKVKNLFLRCINNRYFLYVLGKTGEAKANFPINISFLHRHFRDVYHTTLQTNSHGEIDLGALEGIERITARGSDLTSGHWPLLPDRYSYPKTIHSKNTSAIYVPLMSRSLKKENVFSLLEMRNKVFVRDMRHLCKIKGSFIVIGRLPLGNYSLWLKSSNTTITLRITAGNVYKRYILSNTRYLEYQKNKPLQISKIETKKKKISIALKNVSKTTRVHVIATRFLPAFDPFDNLGAFYTVLAAKRLSSINNYYLSQRNIGDEYRYVLERKYAKKYPGNMLKRPSLLLNPWSPKKTSAGKHQLERGDKYRDDKPADPPSDDSWGDSSGYKRSKKHQVDFGNLNFLVSTSLVLSNLKPNAQGVVSIDIDTVLPRQQLHIVAIDWQSSVYRRFSLQKSQEKYRDLRLYNGLDPNKHFIQQKNTSIALEGKLFNISDITTSKLELYDSLERVYNLFTTLSNNSTLQEFNFILRWPQLKQEKKRELYSQYACHELNFFLYRKDPKFFTSTIFPYLQNKKDKTFLDYWLLGNDLSRYLKPWAFNRLNTVEKILLGQKIKKETLNRHIKELCELLPPNIERADYLFRTALKSSSLEKDSRLNNEYRRKAREALIKGRDGWRKKSKKKSRSRRRFGGKPKKPVKKEAKKEESGADFDEGLFFDKKRDLRARSESVRFYQKLDKTREWVENNYYHVPILKQLANLIKVNFFWRDYAAHTQNKSFYSTYFSQATNNFTEMMFALSVLDLPFKAQNHNSSYTGTKMVLVPANNMVIFHREIKPAQFKQQKQLILISQNFFAHNDRYTYKNNVRMDKYITKEFALGKVYGCQIVLTNPTSSHRKIDLLAQIPQGAIPVSGGVYTKSKLFSLRPYATQTFQYYFYFPKAGNFSHYPVHVAQNGRLIAFANPFTFNVVEDLSVQNKMSWEYISQHAKDAAVFAYLQQNNIERLNLNLIAFRMRNRDFFTKTIQLLQNRLKYENTLWSYGLYHNNAEASREYLQHSSLAQRCGVSFTSPLLTINPIRRYSYQHKEYWPLVNARVHRLGKKHFILNKQFLQQYREFLGYLRYRPKLNNEDWITATIYLLLQDRIEKSMEIFTKIKRKDLKTKIQYDYLNAYLAMYMEKPKQAHKIAKMYQGYGVDRWRKLFHNILAQVKEMEGEKVEVVDKKDRTQSQTQLAATSKSLNFKIEKRKITLQVQNLKKCKIHFYPMDIELLFSRNPFVQQVSGQFSIIKPNYSMEVKLGKNKQVDLPKQYHDKNVMVQVTASSINKTLAYYPHSLTIQMVENYGLLKVTHETTHKPLTKVYVKVYAQMKNGQVQFFKDGYTDLRGRFDYVSLNTDELKHVAKFSILIISDKHGAVVREAKPPKM